MSDMDRGKAQQDSYSGSKSKDEERPKSNVLEFSASRTSSSSVANEKLSRAFDSLKREAEELNW